MSAMQTRRPPDGATEIGAGAKTVLKQAGGEGMPPSTGNNMQLGPHAKICLRFLHTSVEFVREISAILDKHRNDDEVAGLRVAMTLCSSVLANVLSPHLMHTYLRAISFQSWGLVLFQLLNALRSKLTHCVNYNILDITLQGPRLKLFFTRLERKLIAHADLMTPFLTSSSFYPDFMNPNGDGGSSVDDTNAKLAAQLKANGGILTIAHLIEDEEECAWWISSFGKAVYATTWDKFFKALEEHKDPKIVQMIEDPEFREIIISTLNPLEKKAVTAQQFDDFLFTFGPGLRVSMIQLQASIWSPAWFAGALSYDEARCLLTPHRQGTFLVRFSESSVCTWAVSYANPLTGVVNHALVRAYAPNENDHSVFVCGSQGYHSFAELLETHSNILMDVVPNAKNIGPARMFRGFLSYEQAEDMLEGKPVGTFLIRFSQSQDGCLVVAYVTETEGTLQSKIFTDADRGFILGDRVYKRISTLVSENRDKLQFPLSVDDALDVLGDPNSDALDEHMAPPHLGYATLPPVGDPGFGYNPVGGSMMGFEEARYGPLPDANPLDPGFPQPGLVDSGMPAPWPHAPVQYEGYLPASSDGGGLGVGGGFDNYSAVQLDLDSGYAGPYDAMPFDSNYGCLDDPQATQGGGNNFLDNEHR
mmetsp:Transcript_10331/g.20327  ORF Transcript_10331/g.20327 Transcript_10331/m.20327 type:complete len:646 (+) Transcript_10331:123-2060(+)|eukprot:CAMPEP_0171541886 /NCGR_PEP_ID=MMETSP0960-20121227/2030_1 /TAXON_ID=87120 /ORGANISM="Aurantiochytrium limacinum, Strain ATCCMYA-1381" /LENGTH=645 /DNA_ID=CAMNT_0012089305 /DNA_START=21 /DNA_END=1958 /DNA_ORIENTATION=+